MNRLLYIFLSLTLIFNSVGFILLFIQTDSDNRTEIKEKISSHNYSPELEIIKIERSKINFLAEKRDNEFEYNGNMYDLVKIEQEGKYLVLYCLNDTRETNLHKIFSFLVDEYQEKHHHSNQRSVNHIVLSPAIIKFCYIIKRSDEIKIISTTFISNYNSVILNRLTPPPEIIS